MTDFTNTQPTAMSIQAQLAIYEQSVRKVFEDDKTLIFGDEIERQNWIQRQVIRQVANKRLQLEEQARQAAVLKQNGATAISDCVETFKLQTPETSEESDDYEELLAEHTERNKKMLLRYFRRLNLDLGDEEILKMWERRAGRRFCLRTEEFDIRTKQGRREKFCAFTPLLDPRGRLIDLGFYTKYIDTPPSGQRTGLLLQKQKLFKSFIVDGTEAHSLYICGDIGVGKSTFMGNIAWVFSIFLNTTMAHITMPKLLRLITSIDADDKAKVALLERCGILFVDDVGHEIYTTTNQESMMRDFFTYRYGNDMSTFLAGNGNITEQAGANLFYRQLADYINESGVFTICKVSGESRRGAAGSTMGASACALNDKHAV